MEKNLNAIERIIRILLGIVIFVIIGDLVLSAWAVIILAIASFSMFASSATGFCPIYFVLDKYFKTNGKTNNEKVNNR